MKFIKIILCLFLIFSLTSCNDLDSIKGKRWNQAKNPKKEIIIGVAAPWKWLEDKTFYKKGIEFAVKEINSKGGVLGKKFSIIYRDDNSSVDKGRVIAQEFAENTDMVAVIGHFNSHVSIPASIMYQYYGLLMVSATSTSPELTDRKGYNMIFRNIPTDKDVAKKVAEFCSKKGFKRIMIYGINNKWGTSLANTFEYRAAELGINIVDYRTFDFTSDASYFANDISHWRDFFQFDAIFLASAITKATEFIIEARKLGLEMPIIGGDGLDSPMLWEKAGDASKNVIVGTYFHPDLPGKVTQDFVKAFYEKYGSKPDTWAAQGYDAVKLICEAMKKANSVEPLKVSEAMRSMKSWKGVTGIHNFNESGDVINKIIVLQKVEGDHFVFLEKQ